MGQLERAHKLSLLSYQVREYGVVMFYLSLFNLAVIETDGLRWFRC